MKKVSNIVQGLGLDQEPRFNAGEKTSHKLGLKVSRAKALEPYLQLE